MRLRRSAAIIAFTYLVFGIAYILGSDYLVARVAESLKDFHLFERIKGVLFIIITSAALFVFSSNQIKKVIGDAFNLIQNRTLLFSYERKSLAGLFSLTIAQELRNLLPADSQELSARSPECEKLLKQAGELMRKLDGVARTSLSEGTRQVDLAEMIRSSIDIAKGYSPLVRGCDIRLKMADGILVKIYAGLLHQSLVNLLLNAAEAVKGQGIIEVYCSRTDRFVIIEMHDSGPGVPAEQWQSVLDPFYSSKRDGMGFGLLSVQACVAAHHGKVQFSASHLGGARVDVELPLSIIA